MKVGIVGSGIVGTTLAKKLVELGHSVTIGTHTPAKEAELAAHTGAQAGSFADAAAFGDLVIVSVKWDGLENALKLANPANFAGKTVIDTTNVVLGFGTPKPYLAIGFSDSAGEIVQRTLPDANVVKALNLMGAATMINPAQTGDTPDLLIAGNDASAKQQVTALLREFGWQRVIDLGGIEGARALESALLLWVADAMQTGSYNRALKFVG